MNVAVTPVSGTDPIKKVWPHIKSFVQTAINSTRGEMSLEEVAELLLSGEGRLYVAWSVKEQKALGFVITEYERINAGVRTCKIRLIGGGSRKSWTHLLEPLYGDARKEGCVEVVSTLPRGWARDLSDFSITHYKVRLAL